MVTYFNRIDLVEFGKYLLSEERLERIEKNYFQQKEEGLNPLPMEDAYNMVYHADIENWMHNQKNG